MGVHYRIDDSDRRTRVKSLKTDSIIEPKMLAICMAFVLGIALLTVPAQAHKVNLFAYVEGDRVVVEGYFSTKSKAQDSLVEVFDETGNKIHEGKTDKDGIYSFKLADLPAFTGGLRFVLDAGMGHKAEYTLSSSDLPGSSKKEEPAKEQPRKNQSETVPAPAPGGSVQVLDQAALAAALETAMDKKLDPIVRMLGRQEKLLLEDKQGGPRINDIIGGIGWIVGMVGLAAFFWSRNRSGNH
jgi:nickel transport protein